MKGIFMVHFRDLGMYTVNLLNRIQTKYSEITHSFAVELCPLINAHCCVFIVLIVTNVKIMHFQKKKSYMHDIVTRDTHWSPLQPQHSQVIVINLQSSSGYLLFKFYANRNMQKLSWWPQMLRYIFQEFLRISLTHCGQLKDTLRIFIVYFLQNHCKACVNRNIHFNCDVFRP